MGAHWRDMQQKEKKKKEKRVGEPHQVLCITGFLFSLSLPRACMCMIELFLGSFGGGSFASFLLILFLLFLLFLCHPSVLTNVEGLALLVPDSKLALLLFLLHIRSRPKASIFFTNVHLSFLIVGKNNQKKWKKKNQNKKWKKKN